LGFQPKPDFFLERKKQRTFMRNCVLLNNPAAVGYSQAFRKAKTFRYKVSLVLSLKRKNRVWAAPKVFL